MKSLSFQQVDVFTAVPFKGNPVAVLLDGDTWSSLRADQYSWLSCAAPGPLDLAKWRPLAPPA